MKTDELCKFRDYNWITKVEKRLYEAALLRKKMRQENLEKNRVLHVGLLKDEL